MTEPLLLELERFSGEQQREMYDPSLPVTASAIIQARAMCRDVAGLQYWALDACYWASKEWLR